MNMCALLLYMYTYTTRYEYDMYCYCTRDVCSFYLYFVLEENPLAYLASQAHPHPSSHGHAQQNRGWGMFLYVPGPRMDTHAGQPDLKLYGPIPPPKAKQVGSSTLAKQVEIPQAKLLLLL